ncbi:hypothetical protein E2C01_019737 [Portunus trituberculatus]|uniref:Uncharacterized protein n=1 Tax=Portunus trituberculatus TaxID=210409 RepID=A0A5B7E1A0_PORTR|nr:hypothetical protein [Portunus trituberculatus]
MTCLGNRPQQRDRLDTAISPSRCRHHHATTTPPQPSTFSSQHRGRNSTCPLGDGGGKEEKQEGREEGR